MNSIINDVFWKRFRVLFEDVCNFFVQLKFDNNNNHHQALIWGQQTLFGPVTVIPPMPTFPRTRQVHLPIAEAAILRERERENVNFLKRSKILLR